MRYSVTNCSQKNKKNCSSHFYHIFRILLMKNIKINKKITKPQNMTWMREVCNTRYKWIISIVLWSIWHFFVSEGGMFFLKKRKSGNHARKDMLYYWHATRAAENFVIKKKPQRPLTKTKPWSLIGERL